jgi:hypothetical protein
MRLPCGLDRKLLMRAMIGTVAPFDSDRTGVWAEDADTRP